MSQSVGETLENQFERKMAEGCLRYIKRDGDGEWIVDYAGAHAHHLILQHGPGPNLLADARAFAHRERERWQQGLDGEARKLFERYSQLVRYLDAAGA